MNISLLYGDSCYNFDIQPTKTIDFLLELASKILKSKKENFELYYEEQNITASFPPNYLIKSLLNKPKDNYEIRVKAKNESELKKKEEKDRIYFEALGKLNKLKENLVLFEDKIKKPNSSIKKLQGNINEVFLNLLDKLKDIQKYSNKIEEYLNNEKCTINYDTLKNEINTFKIEVYNDNLVNQIQEFEKGSQELEEEYYNNLVNKEKYEKFLLELLNDKFYFIIDFSRKINQLTTKYYDYNSFYNQLEKFMKENKEIVSISEKEELLLNDAKDESILNKITEKSNSNTNQKSGITVLPTINDRIYSPEHDKATSKLPKSLMMPKNKKSSNLLTLNLDKKLNFKTRNLNVIKNTGKTNDVLSPTKQNKFSMILNELNKKEDNLTVKNNINVTANHNKNSKSVDINKIVVNNIVSNQPIKEVKKEENTFLDEKKMSKKDPSPNKEKEEDKNNKGELKRKKHRKDDYEETIDYELESQPIEKEEDDSLTELGSSIFNPPGENNFESPKKSRNNSGSSLELSNKKNSPGKKINNTDKKNNQKAKVKKFPNIKLTEFYQEKHPEEAKEKNNNIIAVTEINYKSKKKPKPKFKKGTAFDFLI